MLAPVFQVGVDLYPMATDWPALRAGALAAEAAGIDSITTWDHLYGIDQPANPIFEAWSIAAALGAVTSRALIGLLVGANTFRNPGVIAKSAVTIDHIAGGRWFLGLGAGWRPREHIDHGLDFGSGPGERLDRLDEALTAIRGLLAGEAVTSPADGYYRLHGASHRPLPVRGPGRLPILIGGGGERKTLPIVARHADIWHHRGSVGELARKLNILREHCAAVGRDPDTITLAMDTYVVIRDEPAQARAALQASLAAANESWEFTDENTWFGPPDLIAERWRPYAELGFRWLMVSLPAPYDRETIERLPQAKALVAG